MGKTELENMKRIQFRCDIIWHKCYRGPSLKTATAMIFKVTVSHEDE